MMIVKKKLSELVLPDYNPRKMTPEQADKLKQSLKKFGYVEPIVWNKKTNHVVGGILKPTSIDEEGNVVYEYEDKK